MQEEGFFYKQLNKKTTTELIHLGLEYNVQNPEKMTREQLIESLINSGMPEPPLVPADPSMAFDEFARICKVFFNRKEEPLIITEYNLKRAKTLLLTCIEDIYNILLNRI